MKFAIVNSTGEFYPDPIYTDRKKAEDKIAYLERYNIENGMDAEVQTIEELSPEREKQHEVEWKQFCSAID
jgi:hypothetical protein